MKEEKIERNAEEIRLIALVEKEIKRLMEKYNLSRGEVLRILERDSRKKNK